MTLLEELMKQYKTTMEDLMIYTNLAEDKLMSFITGDISILDCPAKIFAALAKTFGLIEKFDCIRGYRLPKLIYPYSFNFANNPNMIKKLQPRQSLSFIGMAQWREISSTCANRKIL